MKHNQLLALQQLNFKFSQSPEKHFKTLLCCLIFFTQRYKKLVITSRYFFLLLICGQKGSFVLTFRRLLIVCANSIEVAWHQDTILRTSVLFLKEFMIQLQQAIPRSAEPLAMFLFLKYTKVYTLNLLRSMTTIALFLRKNSSLLEDNPDH